MSRFHCLIGDIIVRNFLVELTCFMADCLSGVPIVHPDMTSAVISQ